MKLLLNMNMPSQLGLRLQAVGHSCRHVREVGLGRAQDSEIIAEARSREEVIVTHDLDYGHMLAFSGEARPSVVTFRTRNTHPEMLFRRLMESWADIEEPLASGAIVTIEDAAIRIRRLPIAPEPRGRD